MTAEKAFELIKNLEFYGDDDIADPVKSKYARLFMKEFLRRILLWARYFKVEEKFPWISVVHLLKPDMPLNEEYGSFIQASKYPLWVKITLSWFMLWVEYKNLPDAKVIDLPEPYTPLLFMYHQGIHFERDHEAKAIHIIHGMSFVDTFPVSKKLVDTDTPFIEADLSALESDAD